MTLNKTTLYIDFINHKGGGVYEIEGYLGGRPIDFKKVYLKLGGHKIDIKKVDRTPVHDEIDQHSPIDNSAFRANFKLGTNNKVKLSAHADKDKLRIKTNKFTGLSSFLMAYKQKDDVTILKTVSTISFLPQSTPRNLLLELITLINILFSWRVAYALKRVVKSPGVKAKLVRVAKGTYIVLESLVTLPRDFLLRLSYRVFKAFKKGEVWLVSDRVGAAGDNGGALFEYINKQTDQPNNVYFVISSSSADYGRMKRIGKVVNYRSLKHLMLFLLSDKVISSHADTEVINPFFRQIDRFVDLYDFDFIFLQHGIIRHDLSDWLNRFNKNIQLFITSSRAEYDSILANNYYYPPKSVLLSGLPRFDKLGSKPKNKVMVVPTYRKFLIKSSTDNKGDRKYSSSFKQSDYFKFYNNLINDKRVLSIFKMHGVTGELYLHPMFRAQAKDFKQNTGFKIAPYPYNYTKVFSEGNLLVSDHSSVVFDFAYLKKPVLYAHFDVEEFYAGHSYKKSDFFDDKQDGFGQVCDDYDSLVQEIIKSVESGFKMPQKYVKRVDEYFEYTDKNNSERVYYAIVNLKDKVL